MQQTIKADTGWRIWWQLTRPHTLTAAFAPVFLGTMIALTYGKIHFPLFIRYACRKYTHSNGDKYVQRIL